MRTAINTSSSVVYYTHAQVIIRDLQPANLLLDELGRLKLTYQCQWVSVDTSLAPAAVAGNFCAPEVEK